MVHEHKGKAEILLDHHKSLMGKARHCSLAINWDVLEMPTFNLEHLEGTFSMDELKSAVFEMHAKKVPGLMVLLAVSSKNVGA